MEEKRKYDLDERTLNFFKNEIVFLRLLHKDFVNVELGRQLIDQPVPLGQIIVKPMKL